MEQAYENSPKTQESSDSRDRWTEVTLLEGLRESQRSGTNLLQFAHQQGVPEATLRYWVSRAQATKAPAAFTAFFESPEGLLVLHRIVIAAVYVLTQICGGGVRTICTFLQLSGLWRVVACGFGTQQSVVKAMEESIITFGEKERERLAAKMQHKRITVTLDETFPCQTCLVASEPVSNFILVEQFADNRRAETWDKALKKGLDGLAVTVFQSTSDEASALLKQARGCGAHHSPDLFHPQQDISRATSLPLQRQAEAATRKAHQAIQAVDRLTKEANQNLALSDADRSLDYVRRLDEALSDVAQACAESNDAGERRTRVRDAARGISEAYHPFDLHTGAVRDAATVKADLQQCFEQIDQVASEAGLSEKCRTLLDKARRLVPQMVATVALVHAMIREQVEALDLGAELDDALLHLLIPLHYLRLRIRKTKTAEARAQLKCTIAGLQQAVDAAGAAPGRLPTPARAMVERMAILCAEWFQRSSSNVEGRNGVLALRHHSIHHLSQRKLSALTVVHNFGVTRSDGTTAAERFFGQKPQDLFEHLLMTLPPPKRPAVRRAMAN
jgi:hypothetical protein